jgi:hypothetical protein
MFWRTFLPEPCFIIPSVSVLLDFKRIFLFYVFLFCVLDLESAAGKLKPETFDIYLFNLLAVGELLSMLDTLSSISLIFVASLIKSFSSS